MKTIIMLVGLLVMSQPVLAKQDIKQLDIREVRTCMKVAKDMERTERQVEKLDLRMERLERLISKTTKRSKIQYDSYERMTKDRNKQSYFYRAKFREYQNNCNGVFVEKAVLDKTCRNSTHNIFCDMFKK